MTHCNDAHVKNKIEDDAPTPRLTVQRLQQLVAVNINVNVNRVHCTSYSCIAERGYYTTYFSTHGCTELNMIKNRIVRHTASASPARSGRGAGGSAPRACPCACGLWRCARAASSTSGAETREPHRSHPGHRDAVQVD